MQCSHELIAQDPIRTSRFLAKAGSSLAAILAVVTIAVMQAQPVAAMSSARTELAANLNELAIACDMYTQPQVWGTLRSQFAKVGVSTAGWNSVSDVAASGTEIKNVTVSESDGGPAPGDVAVFQPFLGYAPVDMAIFVSNGDVVVWSPLTKHFQNVPLAALDNASTKSTVMPFAVKGSVTVYRIPSSRWPGGHDDTTIAPGHIELVTPTEMAKQMDWVLSHPRDPDQSVWHGIWTGVMGALAWVSGVLGAGIGFLMSAGSWLLHHTWILGAAVLAVIGVLTKHFDGSFFNHILTFAIGWPVLGALTLLRLAAGAVGLNGLASILGGVTSFAFNSISLGISVLTGLQGEGESSVGGVLVALVTDYVLVLKPLAASAKAAEIYGVISARYASVAAFGERIAQLRALIPTGAIATRMSALAELGKTAILGRNGLVAWVGKANDFVMLRPTIVLRGLQVATKASVSRIVDIVSLLWRPQSVVVESASHAEALVAAVGSRISSAKEVVEKVAPVLKKTEAVLHSWSAASHITYVASTGHVQTINPPQNLRPSELLRPRINQVNEAMR